MTDQTDTPTPEEVQEIQAAEKARLDELEEQDYSDMKPEPVEETPPSPTFDDGPDYGDEFDDDEDDMQDMEPVFDPVMLDNGHIEVTLNLTLSNIDTLQNGLDTAAATLGRYGMDPFYVLVTEPSTGRRWVVHGSNIFREPEPDERE
jgi:hypothetical protein